MSRSFISPLAFFSALFLITGCLESPLLNHLNAEEVHPPKPSTDSDETCPLSLESEALCASLTWTQVPTSDQNGTFLIHFWKKNESTSFGPYTSPTSQVAVKLWMPSMGHGSSPVTVNPSVDASGALIPGVFEATQVYFVMGGAWEIWIQLKNGSEIQSQAKLEYEL